MHSNGVKTKCVVAIFSYFASVRNEKYIFLEQLLPGKRTAESDEIPVLYTYIPKIVYC
jgi:hypothetical protein